MTALIDRIKAKRGTPCPISMADRARRILAGIGLALAVSSCTPTMTAASKVVAGALTVLDAICETRDSGLLDLARDYLDRGDLSAAIAALKADLVENGPDPEVGALITLLEEQQKKTH